MITSVLIANRGEIARRVIRTAKRMGVRTIAVYSAADAESPFVREADEAYCIGPAPARESYLVQEKVLNAARASGADAIHPGYGFLSENADFAEAVGAAGLIWIGAPPSSIRAMGLKDAAKKLMIETGVPVTPGYLGEDQSDKRLKAEANAIGFPVLIKAVAGGGGNGMRKVDSAADFKDALQSCRREAAASFGDDRVLIEKYITASRHIEVQVFGDALGNVVHLFERDCSLQRRHQKIIEEAPAPGMDEETRQSVCAAAVRAAAAVSYEGAGTIEFIADVSEGLRADRIWFMEMNTRLQVEHPVTEAITGIDLVELQIRVASGEALPRMQDQITRAGWAMEARLYAENPETGFLPSTGKLKHLRLPEHARVDSAVDQDTVVSAHYDPMIAKLIVHAPTRAAAAHQLAQACAAVQVWPVKTNAGFLARCSLNEEFRAGSVDTGFIARHAEDLAKPAAPPRAVEQAAARALLPVAHNDPWAALTGFRVAAPRDMRVDVEIDALRHTIALEGSIAAAAVRIDQDLVVFYRGDAWLASAPALEHATSHAELADGALLAQMPGRIVAIEVSDGATIAAGARILTMEAMKMEHTMKAPFSGKVTLLVECGAHVVEGQVLARIEPEES